MLAGMLGMLAGGCAWYDTMLDQQDLRHASAAPASRSAPVYGRPEAAAPVHATRPDPAADQIRQETAALRVEMNALLDNQRRMLTQIAELQDAIAARDGQVEELRGLVSVLESRLKVSDAEWQGRMDKLRESMTEQNRRSLDAMAQRMAEEMASTVKQVQQAGPGTVVGEHVVRQGDVLSVIAMAYGVSLKDLMEANNLTNDRIFVGQKLKIPAPRR